MHCNFDFSVHVQLIYTAVLANELNRLVYRSQNACYSNFQNGGTKLEIKLLDFWSGPCNIGSNSYLFHHSCLKCEQIYSQ